MDSENSNNVYCRELPVPCVVITLCLISKDEFIVNTHRTYVTVPEKRDLYEANFISRYKPFKNVCHIETNVNLKLPWSITLDWTGLCSCFKVHCVKLIKRKKKMCISQFSYLPHYGPFSQVLSHIVTYFKLVSSMSNPSLAIL